ncbi:Detected protein of unknown function [Hibiscus syriacus]|uniref:Uncharacterized protein n=1 Tax=Hibiscus syriacus TaxID=106335 RepID=A0A6A3C989_HIBSY|nr:Detected protein of unknown function [Hibiscus syriacus]
MQEKFSEFGKIASLAVARDENGASGGFGFVNFDCPDNAKRAMESMKGSKLGSICSKGTRKQNANKYCVIRIFNATDMGNFSNHPVAVEFDTFQDFEFRDMDDSHIGIDINSLHSNASVSASYHTQGGSTKQNLTLKSGKLIQAWIDYDSVENVMNVTIAPTSKRPSPLVFSWWSFKINGQAQALDLSSMPSFPGPPKKHLQLRRGDLLLVYHFMANGSLDKFLFDDPITILNWDQRFRIIKGVASGLLYLPEGYEQIAIHRDVKANTMGYIAPELPKTGKARTSSDVYAFGALLLEEEEYADGGDIFFDRSKVEDDGSEETTVDAGHLSFMISTQGEDTRKNFTDHLYDALNRSGIITFKDNSKMDTGEEIAPQLFRAIQQSWCSVIVFSGTYAFSSWCLEELAEIVKQKNEKGHKVFPIFYDVNPSDLRKQKEKVEGAFTKHETEIGEDDIRIIGICGMGGLGKTTLARVYTTKCHLILKLEMLVGRHDWFGLGSRIIITTRDEHLLQSYRVDDVYKPSTLNDSESLQLSSLKAFDSETAPNDVFIELSEHVAKYASGLPLALEVLGSFLCGRYVAQWRSTIQRLENDSNKEIIDRLRISFDGLEETEKNIFLDIACFFNGDEKDFVMKVLDGCEFFPDIGIDVLIKKSLLTVDENNKLWMHNLLQEMGRRIVQEKSIEEPGKRCRLWEEKDVYHVLTKNTATEVIQGMIIDNKRISNKMLNLNVNAVSKMKKLRLLKVLCLSNCDELKYLPNALRLLDWMGYPLRFLPPSFQPDNLVALLLPYSRIEQLWRGNIQPLYKLKVLNLKGSDNLIKTPDFTTASNMEILILEGCTRIVDVHPSVGVLSRLKLLNLRSCTSLRNLPTKIGIESLVTLILKDCRNLISLPRSIGGCKCLKTLDLSGCYKVENLPENLQQVELLEELDLSETAIAKPPSFIFQLKNLKVLSLSRLKGLSSKIAPNLASLFQLFQRIESVPLMLHSLSGLRSLGELKLRNCNLHDGDIPSDISCLSSLEKLDLGGNSFYW